VPPETEEGVMTTLERLMEDEIGVVEETFPSEIL